MHYSREQLLSLRSNQLPSLDHSVGSILKALCIHKKKHRRGQRANKQNPKSQSDYLKLLVLNAQSVKNKTTEISELISDSKCNILGLTETWLRKGDEDTVIAYELCPPGYHLINVPRPNNSGYGGVGLIYNSKLNVRRIPVHNNYVSFELLCCKLYLKNETFIIFVVYRPPPSARNELTFSQFIADFGGFITDVSTREDKFIVIGDLNVHFDDPANTETMRFQELLDSTNTKQLVTRPTHISNHTLDPIIVNNDCQFVDSVDVVDNNLSDHFTVAVKLKVQSNVESKERTIRYRNCSKIDKGKFANDVQSIFTNMTPIPYESADEIVFNYNRHLRAVLDRHAPLLTMQVKTRASAPWMTEDIQERRKQRRKAERLWRRTKRASDKDNYLSICKDTNRVIRKTRHEYFNRKIADTANNPRDLFRTMRQLSSKRSDSTCLPEGEDQNLANKFAKYFDDKIVRIRSAISHDSVQQTDRESDNMPQSQHTLASFPLCTISEVEDILRKSSTKTCTLDPIPTDLIKLCSKSVAPIIAATCNFSFTEGTVPKALKQSIIRPRIKKSDADPEELSNYRPISNLPYFAKVQERLV